MSNYNITAKTVPTFYFVGVTTGKSSIMKVFPLWMKALGRSDVVIEGIDHKIHDDPEAYRATVAQINNDPLSLGGLVTTHKCISEFCCLSDIHSSRYNNAIHKQKVRVRKNVNVVFIQENKRFIIRFYE